MKALVQQRVRQNLEPHRFARRIAGLVWCHGATFAVLLAGIIWRSNRYWWHPISLWLDESDWATALFQQPLSTLKFRPFGYMLVTRWIAGIYTSEQTLRILSYVPAVVSLFLTIYVSKRFFRTRLARVVCLFVVAAHPVLIDMAREFKPYSLEFCVHLGLIAMFLRYQQTGRRRWLCSVLAGLVLSFLFAYNIVFLWPSMFVLLAVRHGVDRNFRRLAAIGVAASICLLLALAVYRGSLAQMNTHREAVGWARKYDVFYKKGLMGRGSARGHLDWMANKYADLSAFPGVQRRYWRRVSQDGELLSRLQKTDLYGWMALHFAGLVSLIARRRYQRSMLLVSPLLLVIIGNLLELWPMGSFRANTFLLAYLIPISMLSIDWLCAAPRFALRAFGWVAAGCVLLPNLTIGFNMHSHKYAEAGHSDMPQLVHAMLRLKIGAVGTTPHMDAFLDSYTCRPLLFYRLYHHGFQVQRRALVDNFELHCDRDPKQAFRRTGRVKQAYLIIMTAEANNARAEQWARKSGLLLKKEVVANTHNIYLVSGK